MLYKDGLLGQYKSWEVQSGKWNEVTSVFYFSVGWSMRTDHAGPSLHLEVCGYYFVCSISDTRHWDDDTNTWKDYSDLEGNEHA